MSDLRSLPVFLLTCVVLGAAVWLIGAVVFYAGFLVLGSPNQGRWTLWFQAAQAIGEALCIGSAATLIGLLVLKRWEDRR